MGQLIQLVRLCSKGSCYLTGVSASEIHVLKGGRSLLIVTCNAADGLDSQHRWKLQ